MTPTAHCLLPIASIAGAQSRTRTCGARRHLVYSQASLPLEYLCVIDGAGDSGSPAPMLAEG